MSYTITIDHIDTCLSCYLTDHHNRPGEVLIGVPVSLESRVGDVFARLAAEWEITDYNEDMDADVADEIDAQFRVEFGVLLNNARDKLGKPFDVDLDPANAYSETGEQAQAWFLVTYAEEDDEEEDEADATIAAKWLAEIAAVPSHAISGEELIARLGAWIGAGSPDRYYFGFVDPAGLRVVTVQPKDVFFGPDLPMRLDLRNHSPSGFAWGYHGSGPAQLALAILCDAVGATRALPVYQRFKRTVVATWPQEGNWSMTHGEVLAHVSIMEAASQGEGEA